MTTIAQKLQSFGLALPEVSLPAAAYVPYTVAGKIVFISGQLPAAGGKMASTGHLGRNVSVTEGQEAAKICALNVLAHLAKACGGNLESVKRVLKLEILVAAAPEFTEPHLVANGASQLVLDVFGKECGSHARVAYGVATLPMGASVEVAATFELA